MFSSWIGMGVDFFMDGSWLCLLCRLESTAPPYKNRSIYVDDVLKPVPYSIVCYFLYGSR